MEDITGQVANHPKEGELLQMKKSLARKTSSKEENHRYRSLGVQFK